MRLLLPTLLALLLTAAPLRAEDDEPEKPQPHTDEQLKEYEVLEKFKEAYDSDDVDDRILAVRNLGKWRHEKVLKQLAKIWHKGDELELKEAAAIGLGNQTPFPKKAGKELVKGLVKYEDWASREDPEGDDELEQRLEANVLVAGIRAVGDLGYKDGWKQMKGFIDHHDDDVAGEMMLTCGKLKEYRALKILLEWFNFYPDGYSWSGGSVRVDTGAAGNKDAKAAKAKWKAKYGGRAKKARPMAFAAMVSYVKVITGEEIKKRDELKEWMEENKVLLKKHGV